LIIGCGCRGLALARRLQADGHAVRGTTRDPAKRAQIEAAGAEPVVGDPDRIATLARAFEHVAVTCVLLGSASGSSEQLIALHGPRLEMLLARMLDSTVRGIVYESSGSVDGAVLERGAARVRAFCAHSWIPYALLDADPSAHAEWVDAAQSAVDRVLGARR
jgi:nucleoside-diphosphate-sugar epimerase